MAGGRFWGWADDGLVCARLLQTRGAKLEGLRRDSSRLGEGLVWPQVETESHRARSTRIISDDVRWRRRHSISAPARPLAESQQRNESGTVSNAIARCSRDQVGAPPERAEPARRQRPRSPPAPADCATAIIFAAAAPLWRASLSRQAGWEVEISGERGARTTGKWPPARSDELGNSLVNDRGLARRRRRLA